MAVPQKPLEHTAPVGPPTAPTSTPPADDTLSLARLGAELLRRADESQPALETAWDELMARWQIHGEPVGIERLRKIIRRDGGRKPVDNEFSRELIALREESQR